MNKLLGRVINHLRKQHGLTQQDLADRLGMSRQKYARIENGVNDITLNLLVKLAEIFHTTVAALTEAAEQQSVTFCRISEQADEDGIQIVHDMLDLFYANKHVHERMHVSEE